MRLKLPLLVIFLNLKTFNLVLFPCLLLCSNCHTPPFVFVIFILQMFDFEVYHEVLTHATIKLYNNV